MKNNSSKSRFAKITAKVFVMLLAVVLSLSVLPTLSADVLPTAEAAETLNIQSGTSLVDVNNQLAAYPSGTVVNITLGSDIDLLGQNRTEGIVIPEGITANLYLNSHNILFNASSSGVHGSYQMTGIYGIVNKGTLNVFAGSESAPNRDISENMSTIKIAKIIDMQTPEVDNSSYTYAYVRAEAICNYGTVNVNRGVTLDVEVQLRFSEGERYRDDMSPTAVATGIFNATSAAKANVNSAKIDVVAWTAGMNSDAVGYGDCEGTSSSYAYGLYGGSITVTGASDIDVWAKSEADQAGGADTNQDGRNTSIAYGIVSSGNIAVYGGDINYHVEDYNENEGCTKGFRHMNMGGICYKSGGAVPVFVDGNVNANTAGSVFTGDSGGDRLFNEVTIGKTTKLPFSPSEIFDSTSGNLYRDAHNQDPRPGTIEAGQFSDECGNTYAATRSTTDGTHPTQILRGALEGTNRVHIVYRYWMDKEKSAIDSTIVGTEGNAGYSFNPLIDGTDVVNNLVTLSGVTSSTVLTKSPDATIRYITGGDSCNSYYWNLLNLSYAQPSTWFSDYNFTSVSNKGTSFKSFASQGAVDQATPARNGPIYIFVDYARLSASSIKAKVGTSNVATITYTGNPIKASDIGLKILDSIYETDFTREYNIDFAANDLIGITYSYTGTNAAGVNEQSESGTLPTNAGTYEVTLHVAESTTYDKDPKHNKNRYGLDHTFTLIIEQAEILRGTLPEDVNLTYGQKLNEELQLQKYSAQGIAQDTNITGVFSFTNAADGNTFKDAGKGVVSITWTPTYGTAAIAKNYKVTTFNVDYDIKQAPLTISPNASAVIYGNTEFDTPYSVTITGLVANDNTDATKATIASALNYMILQGTDYGTYVVGEVGVGSYYIRATFSDVPEVLSNYEYSYVYGAENNPEGVLKVSPRAISVVASAKPRAYSPDDYTATVTFEITSGRYGSDDVRIAAVTGGLANNNAGTREVGGISKQDAAENATGGAAGNYYVESLTYNTGDVLYVEISKAVPTVTTPVVAEMFYQRSRTLNDVSLEGSTTSVAGRWEWVDNTINPTVKVQTYKAQFVPDDENNYEIKVVDVVVKVKTTPVVISYAGTVSYGDNIPNITAYTYTADLDPSFNIEAVTTSGNITPYTEYVKGSPVIEGGYAVEISAPNFVDVNGNYSFSTVNGVITVKPRNIEFTVEDTSVVYGENFVPSASTVKVTYDESDLVGTDTIENVTLNGTEPTFEYSTDFRYIDNYKVGSYYIKATPNFITSPNYTVSAAEGTLRVTKAQLVIKADDITLEYGSALPADIATAYDVVGAKRNEGIGDVISSGAIKVDTTYEKGSPVNTDGYPITIDVTGAVFNNYTVSVQHGTITVVKATPKVTSLPVASIIHGETLGNAIFTGGAVENDVAGKYLYDSASTAPAYRAEAYTIYTATFIPADTVNYNTVKGLYVALTVNMKPVSGDLAVSGVPMVGETLKVDVAGLDPDELGVYTITWYNANGVSIGTGEDIDLTSAHELQKLTVKAVANAPYTGEVVYVTTTIAPALTSVETILDADNFDKYFDLSGLSDYLGEASYIYNAQPHYVEFQRDNTSLSGAAIGGVTVKYNGSTAAPTTVGYYTVTIDIATPEGIADMSITTDANGNTVDSTTGKIVYSPVANYKIGTLIITQAPYYVNVEVQDKVYDGTGAATAVVTEQYGACELTGGLLDDVSYDEDAAVYYFASSDVGADIDVFVNNALLKGEAADNYELLISMSNDAKADITRRTLKIKVNPVEREYEANNYYVDLSFETVGNTLAAGDDGLVYVDEALVQGAIDNYRAGTRNVTVSGAVLTGSKAGNYVLELTNLEGLKVQILKATPAYPIPMTDVLYYDSARTLKSVSLGDSRWTWDSEVINEVPGAGVHTYKAIYTPDDTMNYATVEYDVELEILKTTVTITAANFTVTYGDVEPTYYYTVTGLTGADTIKNSVDGYVLMNCSYAAGGDVGLYDIVLTGAFESENYSFVYVNGKVTVNKRAAYVEAIAEDREYEPGNNKVNVTFSALTNIYGTDTKNVYLEGSFPIEGTIENENAGQKNVTYTVPALAGSKAINYELRLLNPTLTVEIKKAVIKNVILPTTGVVDYGQKLSTTIFTSGHEGYEYGTFTMENPTSTPKEVGTTSDVYKVVFTPFNTTNYATISDYITLTVNPAALNLVISLTGTAQVGKSLYALTNDIPANAAQYLYFEWYRVDSADADYRTGYKVASGSDYYTLAEGDGGKYIICRVINVDGSPYECEATCITDTSIEEQSLTFWQRLVNWFYRLISNITQIFGRIM